MDCSQKGFGTFLVPVGHGQASVSEPNRDVARSRSEADDPRECEPSVSDSLLITNGRGTLRKRFYILFVARGEDGQLRKIHITVTYHFLLSEEAAIVAV